MSVMVVLDARALELIATFVQQAARRGWLDRMQPADRIAVQQAMKELRAATSQRPDGEFTGESVLTAAKYLGVSQSRIRLLACSGRLGDSYKRPNGTWVIDPAGIARYRAERRGDRDAA